jgi:hypothetical protein
MFRAVTLKELRETRGIILLALAAYGVVLWYQVLQMVKWNALTLPFADAQFIMRYLYISAALAIALGLRQTLGESIVGTYSFLFHRPATRQWLISMKLLTGLAVYLLCALLPIAVYGLIAATPGTHASPFFWSMTLPTLLAWLAITPLYFGAFLSGIRPGSWFFSRLFPLAGAGMAAITTALVHIDLDYGFAVSLIPIILVDIWLISQIKFVVKTRDYA